MAIRRDQSITIILNNIDTINDKSAIRIFLLNQWIIEASNTKHRYFVENLVNGNRIYLERPGRLNKGCDFIIFIQNYILFKNGNDKPPRHDFITKDLAIKKLHLTSAQWTLLLQAIESIYNCQSFQTAFELCNNLPTTGEPYELILKTVRWLFIEQDITYWSGKGRNMLYTHILKL